MNKYSKQRIDKRGIRFNKWMNLKKCIRLNTKKLKPLSKVEKFLYEMDTSLRERFSKVDNDKYLAINDIYMLNFISKTKCKELYKGIVKLHSDNPLKGYLGGEVNPSELKKNVEAFSDSYNSERWSFILSLSPKDSELYEISNFVRIHLFEISDDFIGISFHLNLTDKAKQNFISLLTKKYNDETNYIKFCRKNKVAISHIRGEMKRNIEIEDYILDIKNKFNKMFINYLPLELNYVTKAPISLNVYKTNYDLKNEKSQFLNSLNILDGFEKKEIENVSVCVSNKGKSDTFIKTKIWYDVYLKKNELERSSNVYYYLEETDEIKNDSWEYINFFILTLSFYELEEMLEEISNERNVLYNLSPKNIKKNFSHYLKLNNKIQKYSLMFNGLKFHYSEYGDDEDFKKYLSNINNRYELYLNQYNKLSKEYSFRAEINNSVSSFNFSKVSIVLALLAMLLTIYFEYQKNTQDKKEVNIDQCKVTIVK